MITYKLNSFSNADFMISVDKGVHTADFPSHYHDFTELTIVTSGSATHVVEGLEYPIRKGSVMSVNPCFAHEYKDVDNLEHYNFMFDVGSFALLENGLKKLKGFRLFFETLPQMRYRRKFIGQMVLDDEQFEFTSAVCELIYKEFKSKSPEYKILVKTYFTTLLAYISNIYVSDEESIPEAIEKIIQSVEYIEENFNKKISIAELSEIACLSERHYSRLFKKVYGISPAQYIINCRVDHARLLIRSTDATLTEIAYLCGFSDNSAFSKTFLKKYGVSPSQYREEKD